jgi:hypothetical protein
MDRGSLGGNAASRLKGGCGQNCPPSDAAEYEAAGAVADKQHGGVRDWVVDSRFCCGNWGEGARNEAAGAVADEQHGGARDWVVDSRFCCRKWGAQTRQWTAVVQVEWVCRFGREPFDLWLETDIQMTYLLITHLDESAWFSQSEAERQQLMAEPMAYVERLKASGKFLDGAPLHPSSAGATVRTRDGKTLVTDGPFAETREQIGGYTLIDAKDQDEAIAIATGFLGPNSFGSIEVRAVAELPDGSGRSKR